MDLAVVWLWWLQLPVDVLTTIVSALAVVFWGKLYRRISTSGDRYNGWAWIYAAVIMAAFFNITAMIFAFEDNNISARIHDKPFLTPAQAETLTSLGRLLMAFLLTSGAYHLYRLVRGSGDAKFTFQMVESKSEDRNPDEPRFELAPGASYFVREGPPGGDVKGPNPHSDRRLVSGMDIFTDLVTHGRLGVCLTRKYPQAVRDEYRIVKTPIMWLTREKVMQGGIHPTDLPGLSHTVKDFLGKGPETVVILDGVEYLILHTTFNEVLKMIQGINDIVAMNKANLILTVDPAALTEQQFHLLSRELIEFTSEQK